MPRNYNNQSKIDIDFGKLNSEDQNREVYQRFAGEDLPDISAQSKLVFPLGYRLLVAGTGSEKFEIALLCDTSKEVVYYIDCNVWEDVVLDGKPVTQVMLWRSGIIQHQAATSGLAQEIFRNYLLEKFNIIASDSCPTIEGRDFWVRQMGYALHFSEYVYRYHRITGELTAITDQKVIVDNSCDLWGDTEEYENILAVISKSPIKKADD